MPTSTSYGPKTPPDEIKWSENASRKPGVQPEIFTFEPKNYNIWTPTPPDDTNSSYKFSFIPEQIQNDKISVGDEVTYKNSDDENKVFNVKKYGNEVIIESDGKEIKTNLSKIQLRENPNMNYQKEDSFDYGPQRSDESNNSYSRRLEPQSLQTTVHRNQMNQMILMRKEDFNY